MVSSSNLADLPDNVIIDILVTQILYTFSCESFHIHFLFQNAPIQINSRKNISLSAIDSKGNVVGQISMDEKKIVLKNKKLYIQDVNGRTMLYADDQKIRMDIQNMHITGINPVSIMTDLLNLIPQKNNLISPHIIYHESPLKGILKRTTQKKKWELWW